MTGASDVCWHCNKERRTFMHMLWDCPTARQLWKEVDTRVKIVLGFSSQISVENYILGYISLNGNLKGIVTRVKCQLASLKLIKNTITETQIK
uniref:Reverse transcriptase zinc-binding domain-containing protein n=1 Tax=Gopherus agassizii TaxID=38772 RepID=A0A452IRH3_9SAUR